MSENIEGGERSRDWKPTVCGQLQLRLEEETDGLGARDRVQDGLLAEIWFRREDQRAFGEFWRDL